MSSYIWGQIVQQQLGLQLYSLMTPFVLIYECKYQYRPFYTLAAYLWKYLRASIYSVFPRTSIYSYLGEFMRGRGSYSVHVLLIRSKCPTQFPAAKLPSFFQLKLAKSTWRWKQQETDRMQMIITPYCQAFGIYFRQGMNFLAINKLLCIPKFWTFSAWVTWRPKLLCMHDIALYDVEKYYLLNTYWY